MSVPMWTRIDNTTVVMSYPYPVNPGNDAIDFPPLEFIKGFAPRGGFGVCLGSEEPKQGFVLFP